MASYAGVGLQVAGGFVKAMGDMSSANAGSAMALTTGRMNQQYLQQQADTSFQLGDIAYQRVMRQGLILKGGRPA